MDQVSLENGEKKYATPKWSLKKIYLLLFSILLFSFFTKITNIDRPHGYIFDEVFYGFAAEEYAIGNFKAWNWEYQVPSKFAIPWAHPPLGLLITAIPIRLLGKGDLSRRIMPLIAGVLITFMVFQLGMVLFPNQPALALLAAVLSSLDGLSMALSRISMPDTLLTLFIITSIFFAFKKNYVWSAILFGMACSTKWTGLCLIIFFGITTPSSFSWKEKQWRKSLLHCLSIGLTYCWIGSLIYLMSYLPFLYHADLNKWWDLQKQMLGFHLHLNLTHDWSSKPWTWPFDRRPVWMYVKYLPEYTRNIYAMGNPIIFWGGIIAFFYTVLTILRKHFTTLTENDAGVIKEKQFNLCYLLGAYLICWTPWMSSPRIMFMNHYLPAVPFLCIILAFSLHSMASHTIKLRWLPSLYVALSFVVFCFFYPYWTGIAIPNRYISLFHWLNTWAP